MPGFLTTFTMLARDKFQASEIWWTMINVFFGCVRLGQATNVSWSGG